MRTKSFLSLLVLSAFAILGGGSYDSNGNLEPWVYVVLVVFGIIAGLAFISSEEQENKRKQQAEKARKEREEKLRIKTEEYNTQKQQFIAENGTPDKSIVIEQLDLNAEIHVYETSKQIFIQGKKYAFKDIMSCTFSDSPRVIKGKVTAVTKSKNGDVIGRAIVGDLVAGSAGAVIGGTTANKHTEFTQGEDRTVHDYTVIITVNSISNPVLRIHTGERGKLTNEIVGLMNVIIARK